MFSVQQTSVLSYKTLLMCNISNKYFNYAMNIICPTLHFSIIKTFVILLIKSDSSLLSWCQNKNIRYNRIYQSTGTKYSFNEVNKYTSMNNL